MMKMKKKNIKKNNSSFLKDIFKHSEKRWRTLLRTHFPLRSNVQLIESKTNHHWHFATDLKDIFYSINDEEYLKQVFSNVVSKYWNLPVETLFEETFVYLLFHEVYHPIEAPKSKEDDKKTIEAIRKGLLKSNPILGPLEQLLKIKSSKNIVQDFILDNRLYLDNIVNDYFEKTTIPIFDVVELNNSDQEDNIFNITRYLYAFLYGEDSVLDFFSEKLVAGVAVAKESLEKLLGKKVSLNSKKRFDVVENIREVFSSDKRYKAIEKFISVLEPYIPISPTNKYRVDLDCSLPSIFESLIQTLNSNEQQQFTSSLLDNDLEEILGQNNVAVPNISSNDLEDLKKEVEISKIKALHEYYKNNNSKIKIFSRGKSADKLFNGKEKQFVRKRSNIITEEQLQLLNLKKIEQFQRNYGLPVLIPLNNGIYTLLEYDLVEKNFFSKVYSDLTIKVPDVIEFYIDSSGSMFDFYGSFKPGDNSRWDFLSRVFYGFLYSLNNAESIVGKKSKLRIHNFAEETVFSNFFYSDDFLSGEERLLELFFKPGNGFSSTNLNIKEEYHKNSSYVIITDGQLSTFPQEEYAKMKRLSEKNISVLLFEIGGTYDLGSLVKKDPSILYYQVHSEKDLLSGLEVLISK